MPPLASTKTLFIAVNDAADHEGTASQSSSRRCDTGLVVRHYGIRAGLGRTGHDADTDSVNPPPDLDHALELARSGDARGFDTLYRSLGGAVSGYLRARGVSDADGLANDVFVRAFRKVAGFEGGAEQFRSWLFRIARNAAIDDARRRKRRVSETSLDAAPESIGGDVERDVISRLAQERVRARLERLSPDQRDVLLLRIVADLSVEETAAALGKGYEAVKALQRRGLAALRRQLSEEEGVPQ